MYVLCMYVYVCMYVSVCVYVCMCLYICMYMYVLWLTPVAAHDVILARCHCHVFSIFIQQSFS